ncbi:hypothetical protein [Luteibacter sp. SG786]|uniref:hypothetical protein n=1 Tax=Luteibacter sp. SG786 TaxID=2587130 RepID=UPI001423DC5A|nr:hypothetical protein [Luteibacter sp. SG786]NII55648.1 nucleotide-binding universal stress UspA family protein [Luteibacter sp. SG786]
MRGVIGWFVLGAWVVAAASGCSANRFKVPVHAFAVTAAAAKATAKVSDDMVKEQEVTADIEGDSGRDRKLLFSATRCDVAVEDPDCSLRDLRTDAVVYQTDPAAETSVLATALDTYARSLTALVDAQSAEEFNASADKLSQSVGKLFAMADKDGNSGKQAAAVIAVAKPVVDVFLEHRRLSAIRQAVSTADPAVQLASERLVDRIRERQRFVIGYERNRVINLVTGANGAGSPRSESARAAKRRDLEDASRGAQRLRALTSADMAIPFVQVRTAHSKLLHALEDPKVDVRALAAEMAAYAASAKQAYDAVAEAR